MKIILKSFLALLLIVPLTARAADEAETKCRARLKQLGGAVKAYQLLHDNKLPAKLSDLYTEGLAENLSDFVCPASDTTITMASEIDAKTDYTLEPSKDTKDMLVREKTPRHGNTVLAIFADGSIKALAAPGGTTAPSTPTTPVTPPPPVVTNPPPQITTPPVTPPVPPTNPQITNRETKIPAPPQQRETDHGVVIVKKQPGIEVDPKSGVPEEMPSDVGLSFAFDKDGKLLVTAVNERGMGKMLGIRVGDVVTELENKPMPKKPAGAISFEELAKLAGVAPGDDLILSIRSADGSEMGLALPTPGGPPPAVQLIPHGMVVTPQRPVPDAPALGEVRLTAYVGAKLGDAENGALVSEITPGAPAESAGLKSGDLIVALDGEPVANSQQVSTAIASKKPGDRVNFLVIRQGKNLKITVTLGAQPTIRR